MRILIITQDDTQYLPTAVARVCEELCIDIACIVVAPTMKSKGGRLSGFFQHVGFFGPKAAFTLGYRVFRARLLNLFIRSGPAGPFYSIKSVADTFNIPFYAIQKLNSPEFYKLLDRYEPDLLIAQSCPQIIGKKILDRFPMGAINVHGAPLPRYRGMMPSFWVLCNGETATASTVHDLDAKLDNGDILVQREVSIEPEDTWDSLVRKTKNAGTEALIEAVNQIKAGTVDRQPNIEKDATYFSFPTYKNRKTFLASGRRFF
jgi:methionyl-tRNA formyltransferase